MRSKNRRKSGLTMPNSGQKQSKSIQKQPEAVKKSIAKKKSKRWPKSKWIKSGRKLPNKLSHFFVIWSLLACCAHFGWTFANQKHNNVASLASGLWNNGWPGWPQVHPPRSLFCLLIRPYLTSHVSHLISHKNTETMVLGKTPCKQMGKNQNA